MLLFSLQHSCKWDKKKKEVASVSSRSHGKVRLTSRTSCPFMDTTDHFFLSVGFCTRLPQSFFLLIFRRFSSFLFIRRKRIIKKFDKIKTIKKKKKKPRQHSSYLKKFAADEQRRRWIETMSRQPRRTRARWLDPLGPSQHHRWWTNLSVFAME